MVQYEQLQAIVELLCSLIAVEISAMQKDVLAMETYLKYL